MPGYHVPNINYIPEGPHMGHHVKAGPPGPHYKKDKKSKHDQVRKVHPMFEAHRYHPGAPAFQGGYGYPRHQPMGGYPGYGPPAGYMGYDSHHQAARDHDKKPHHKFDSTMLLGNDNDTSYLDNFMNTSKSKDGKSKDPAEHLKHPRKSVTSVPTSERTAPSSERSTGIKNSRSRNSLNLDSVAATLLQKMRSAASDEEIYESMEIIHHRKTLEHITRRDQTAKVKKAGHPLFDHLRSERAIKEFTKPHRQQHAHTLPLPREQQRAVSPQDRSRCKSPYRSGSSSPPEQIWPTAGPLSKHPAATRRAGDMRSSDGNSSSGSGDDDFHYVPRANHRFSRSALKTRVQDSDNHHRGPQEDSDDDWAIPRPSFGLGDRSRRTGAPSSGLTGGVQHQRQVSTDESDSSSKSTGLR